MSDLGDQVKGVILGLAAGDVHGAPFEGDFAARTLWKFIGKTRSGERRWTDDTQMSVDLAESLLECGGLDVEHLSQRFAASYAWSRGYGPGAAKTLKALKRGVPIKEAARRGFPDGSWGNGGAMRAPILALWPWENQRELLRRSHESASITHAHPEGQDGAWLLAHATSLALEHVDASAVWLALVEGLQSDALHAQVIRAAEVFGGQGDPMARALDEFGTGMSVRTSCVTAIFAALWFRDRAFGDLLKCLRSRGGDVDTLSAMAGAVWGGYRGASALPQKLLEPIEQRTHLEFIADRLAAGMVNRQSHRGARTEPT